MTPPNDIICLYKPPSRADPNRSGSTTWSIESKLELYAQNVATNFLIATRSTVAKWMKRFEWVYPDSTLYFSPQYVSVFVLADHRSALEKMEICLGKAQIVKAIDDGGISMYFRRDPLSTQQSRCVILSVEVRPLPDNYPNESRQNEKSTQKKTMKTQKIAMRLKYSPKC